MSAQPTLKKDPNSQTIQESYLAELKFRGEYSAGNLIYKGYARPGAATSDDVWQIAKLTYSGSDLTQVDWAQDSNGIASADYKFIWDNRATYNFS